MKKRLIFIIVIFISIISGCENDVKEQEDLIYTSIYPIQFLTEQIVGNEVAVKSIIPPGVDAHSFELSSKEMTDIAKGEAFIFLGAGMESFAEATADALNSQDVTLVEIGKHEELFMKNESDDHHHGHEDDEHDHGDLDPHIWLDPLRMIDIGKLITAELSALHPNNQKQYEENMNNLEKELTALDEQFVDVLSKKEDKHVLVNHAAFGYWEDRYGIKQIAISGLSSSDEPSQKDLAKITKLAEEKQLKYVLYDQTGSNRVAKIVQEHLGAEERVLHNLEVLTDEDINHKDDYFSLMKHNLNILDEVTN
ncbi:zinc transport system substrate-binding protein [Cerasibacillus quisquiliarum]|uniref:Adhesin n=1 Tax=Cerasibacillus quisquiliarum TaxID=227865 RepID=A0A511UTB0_9BACI|nr:zinc ABC transporter substrate-binding protein [Cerasibacillus quisquiliarum]MBB5145270.1 zinc transport system substrate-binding protein [Cerasibacillus quisquiliarum]GEN29839.1 adhesin [Cerasibacillus quisquiliarum]